MKITDERFLEIAWFNLVEQLGVRGNVRVTPISIFSRLLRAYQESGRHHHNVTHIRMCLELAQEREHLFPNPTKVVPYALFFHDAVNDPLGKENELKSAHMATEYAKDLGLSGTFISGVWHCIMATRHNGDRLDTVNEMFTADIDLAILASDKEVYDTYALNIRKEYPSILDEVFYPERLKILQMFLDRKHLYQTEYFQKRYSDKAKENLAREIRTIESLINA